MPLPEFIEAPRFELLPGWRYTSETMYETSIRPRGSAERRNLAKEFSRTRITVQVPPDRESDIPYLRRYYRNARGRTVGFRVQDPSDYLSTERGSAHLPLDPQPAATDQPLVEIESTSGIYELFKQYTIGEGTEALSEERIIRKPVISTLLIANEDGEVQAADTWSIDSKGRLVANGGFDGTPTTWGGQFDLAMRFDSELPIEMERFRLDTVSFVLLELPFSEQ